MAKSHHSEQQSHSASSACQAGARPVLLLVTPTLVSFRVFLSQLAARLVAAGWQVHVATCATRHPGDHCVEGPATIHQINFPRGANVLMYARAAKRLRELVREIQPTIVHAHLHPAVIAAALARRPSWPIVLGTFHGLIHTVVPPGWRRALYKRIEAWATRRLDDVWVLTAGDVPALALPNVHLQSTIGIGADQSVFDPAQYTPEDRHAKRREIGVPDHAMLFTYVGRQTDFKGFPETAQAALELTNLFDDVHFLLVGTPDERHPDGLDHDQRQRLTNHPRIHVRGWEEDVASLLHASDCFVFPSAREGMAVCIMEALSMGVPVVTTPARGCRELVEHEHNGWIVEKNAAALTKQLGWLHDHPDALQACREAALAERSKFSRERFIEDQIALYDKLATSVSPGN